MFLLLALATGCDGGPYGAPYGAYLEVPGDQGLIFDMAYSDPSDGIGLLALEQVRVVIDSEANDRTEPLNDIVVEITSGWADTYVVPAGAVTMVDSFAEACEGDASPECGYWYDSDSEQFVEFAGEYEDLGGLRPTYMSGVTNERGVLEFYVFFDSIPVDEDGEVIPIPLYASIGVDTEPWSYDFE